MKLLQRTAPDGARQVIAGDGDDIRVVTGVATTRELALAASHARLAELIGGGACDVDIAPLHVAAAALERGEVGLVGEFRE